jgi:hypothetical protein
MVLIGGRLKGNMSTVSCGEDVYVVMDVTESGMVIFDIELG